jgi:hypothetical protein
MLRWKVACGTLCILRLSPTINAVSRTDPDIE